MIILTKENLEYLNISFPKFSDEELEKITTTEFNYNDFLEYKAANEWYEGIRYSPRVEGIEIPDEDLGKYNHSSNVTEILKERNIKRLRELL